MKPILIGVFLLMLSACAVCASDGWSPTTLGSGVGDWDASVGIMLWIDKASLRNLQLRGDIDLAPGLRMHAVVRSNSRMDRLQGVSPHLDEGYLEAFGFHKSSSGILSCSLRVGATRYLRFPYPDAISLFDQVPGVSDLDGGVETGYNGGLLTLDYAHKSGLGAHFTGIKWGFGREGGADVIEGYGSYRVGRSPHFEARIGRLPVRPEPLGSSENGWNAFLGVDIKQYSVGLLYEKLEHQPTYTGVVVKFASTLITRALGKMAFDYDRSPQGIAAQIPLASGKIGRISRKVPNNGTLVGEIKAERFRTYWQNGQIRNYYEHRISSWGETGKRDLIVVMDEEPWVLEYEALVSPHVLGRDALDDWERDRMGPAHVTQKVTYKFYRL